MSKYARCMSGSPIPCTAFVRVKNEGEFLRASVASCARFFDSVHIILNCCTDDSPAIAEELSQTLPHVKVLAYSSAVAPPGANYHQAVQTTPSTSIARYYNWCLEQITTPFACKWDADMIALPPLGAFPKLLESNDVVCFDGVDAVGASTTSMEPRLFRVDSRRARYIDWDLYEVLQHDYARVSHITDPCYVHLKLVRRDSFGKSWRNPNDLYAAEGHSGIPHHVLTGRQSTSRPGLVGRIMRRLKLQ